MSEFVFLFRSTEVDAKEAMGTPEQAQQSMEAMLAWIRDLEERGHLKNPGQPLERTGTVLDGAKKTVIDGPGPRLRRHRGARHGRGGEARPEVSDGGRRSHARDPAGDDVLRSGTMLSCYQLLRA